MSAGVPGPCVGIIGGGMMGLCVAHELASRGFEVEVVEAGTDVGGLVRPLDFGPFVWDRFYHCILRSDSELLSLLDELGLGAAVRWQETASGFFYRGRSHRLDTLQDFLFFRPLRPWERLRLGLFLLACGLLFRPGTLESQTCRQFLERYCGRRVWEVVWHPLLKAKLGPAAERTSARFILESIRRLHSARRGIRKREVLGYVVGGYARVLAALEGSLSASGVRLRTGIEVTEVRSASGPDQTVELETSSGPRRYRAVIVTLAGPRASRLLPSCTRLRNGHYLGVVVAGIVSRKAISPYYILNISDPAIEVTGLIGMSNLVRDGTFGDCHLSYMPRYLTAEDPAWGMSEEAWRTFFRAQLARLAPHLDEEDVISVKLSAAREVQPILDLGYSDHAPPLETGLQSVWLVSSSQCSGGPINVNAIVGQARRAVRSLEPALGALHGSGR